MSTSKSSAPPIHPLTEAAARGLARALLESRQWWVIPLASEAGCELAAEVATRHYATAAASRDWLVIMGPGPVVFCRKRHAPAAALARLLAEHAPMWSAAEWRTALREQDILVPVTLDDPIQDAETLARLLAWHDWLMAA